MAVYVMVTNGTESRWRKCPSMDVALTERAWLHKLVAARLLFGVVGIVQRPASAREDDPVAQFERQESF